MVGVALSIHVYEATDLQFAIWGLSSDRPSSPRCISSNSGPHGGGGSGSFVGLGPVLIGRA